MTPTSAQARAVSAYSDQASDFILRNPGLAREIARQLNSRLVAKGLTRRQRDCLAFIQEFVAANGNSPSFDEIMEGLGLASKSGVHRLVSCLEDRGHINKTYGGARSISLRSVL